MRYVAVGGGGARRWLTRGSSFKSAARALGFDHAEPVHAWNALDEQVRAGGAWERITGRARDDEWRAAGERLASALTADQEIELIVSHGSGAQIVAEAVRLNRDRMVRLRWLALDPAVRPERDIQDGYRRFCERGVGIVQTVSAVCDLRSWPRWAEAKRWPWDRARLPGAVVVPQPDGHAEVLDRPYGNFYWWRAVFGTVRGLG